MGAESFPCDNIKHYGVVKISIYRVMVVGQRFDILSVCLHY